MNHYEERKHAENLNPAASNGHRAKVHGRDKLTPMRCLLLKGLNVSSPMQRTFD